MQVNFNFILQEILTFQVEEQGTIIGSLKLENKDIPLYENKILGYFHMNQDFKEEQKFG